MNLTKQQEAAFLEKLKVYKAKPEVFIREILHAEPTEQQLEALNLYAKPNAHLSIKSAHGCGKSAFISWLIIHSLFFFDEIKIGVSAPTGAQIEKIVFAEVRLWLSHAEPWWSKQIKVTSESIRWVDEKGNQFNREALKRVSRPENVEALAGLHSKNMRIFIDESSGMNEGVFPTIEGALSTDNSKIVLISNPTRTSGYFFKTHTDNEDGMWDTLTFSAEKSPLVSKVWIKYMEKKYGRDSDVFRVRVLGEFPQSTDDIFMKRHFVEAAYYRDIKDMTSQRIAGLDVGRGGADESCIVVKQGLVIKYIEGWHKDDAMWTAAHVHDIFREGVFDVVYVDTIGVGGPVYDRLKQLGVPCVPVNVANSSTDKVKWSRLRDEIWYNTRVFFEEGLCGVDQSSVTQDEYSDLVDELCAVQYGYNDSNGALKIESKREMKKRKVASPNKADALTFCFVNGITGVGGLYSETNERAQEIDMTTPSAYLG